MRLKDRVALITGGAAGIGKATARRFLKEGARVVICDVNVKAGQAAVEELGGDVEFYQVNVADRQAVQAWVDDVVAKYGREVIDRVRVDQANQLRHDKPARRLVKQSRWLLLRNVVLMGLALLAWRARQAAAHLKARASVPSTSLRSAGIRCSRSSCRTFRAPSTSAVTGRWTKKWTTNQAIPTTASTGKMPSGSIEI